MTSQTHWRNCNACKQPISTGATYWVCNVSTCNRKRTGMVFCSVSCWEVHLPTANHRETWAVEKVAPRTPEATPPPRTEKPRRRVVRPGEAAKPGRNAPREILIVASRLKEYVRARSGFNTSDGVLGPLSDIVRRVCDEAIRNAELSGRRTILDRDVPSD